MGKKTAYFGVFVALALIFSYVESLVPLPVGVPGVKLGLANLVVVMALYECGIREACLLSILRILLAGFLFGSLFSILYSLAGGMLSLLTMALVKKDEGYSIYGVSMWGGIMHNIGQLLMATLVTESRAVLYYLPYLLPAGLLTGLLIGATAKEVRKRIGREMEKRRWTI